KDDRTLRARLARPHHVVKLLRRGKVTAGVASRRKNGTEIVEGYRGCGNRLPRSKHALHTLCACIVVDGNGAAGGGRHGAGVQAITDRHFRRIPGKGLTILTERWATHQDRSSRPGAGRDKKTEHEEKESLAHQCFPAKVRMASSRSLRR